MKSKSLYVKWELPTKIEAFLIGTLSFLLFWIDILQNKLQDKGLSYLVHFTSTYTMSALTLFWIVAFSYVLVIFAVISRNRWVGKPHTMDYFIGSLIVFGFVLIVVGAITGFAIQGLQPVEWLLGWTQIDVYHLAIASQILGIFYFTFTKTK